MREDYANGSREYLYECCQRAYAEIDRLRAQVAILRTALREFVTDGLSRAEANDVLAATAKEGGMSKCQNWAGECSEPCGYCGEPTEIDRLRAENAQLREERDRLIIENQDLAHKEAGYGALQPGNVKARFIEGQTLGGEPMFGWNQPKKEGE